ncbi:MAG: hypothetical protein INF16_02210 [Methylobacterium sp.]|jgi:hypothetical protein|nr:hypothetical protein [Methylobacterium sp.]MCE2931611.1 hypothetical protein [Hyphomicrobiales bacterium]MCA3636612.1 hypothetical protein [Methylobacterium sp.]MCA3638920.1 hypothetical protein [Methylobacterium sp.]MCA3643539.1 hypothetical protein [Methylobacterium sp.]
MIYRRRLPLLLCLFIAGCQTAGPGSSLPKNDIRQHRIVETQVRGIENIFAWPREEENFANSSPAAKEALEQHGLKPSGQLPGLREQLQTAMTSLVDRQVSNVLGSELKGPRPVKLVLTIQTFDIPSPVRRTFVDQHAKFQATIDLVDVRTGETLSTYAGSQRAQFMLGGLGGLIAVAARPELKDVSESLVGDYMRAYKAWLLKTQP